MKEEDRNLLLKDLSARVPYGVKYMKYSWGYDIAQEIPEIEVLECVDKNGYISHTKVYTVEDIKPYLFPLSSMTEEQEKEYLNTCNGYCTYYWTEETFDWLNENHFDYRGLIPMNLANDATGLNIY